MDINTTFAAAEAACRGGSKTPEEIALAAANNMPDGSSEFDRGLAAGIAIARFLALRAPEEFEQRVISGKEFG